MVSRGEDGHGGVSVGCGRQLSDDLFDLLVRPCSVEYLWCAVNRDFNQFVIAPSFVWSFLGLFRLRSWK